MIAPPGLRAVRALRLRAERAGLLRPGRGAGAVRPGRQPGDTTADVHSIARAVLRVRGPTPSLLAELAGIEDPLDEQVMRAYWTGGPLLDAVDRADFGTKLLDVHRRSSRPLLGTT